MYEQKKKEFTEFLKPRGVFTKIILGGIMLLFAFLMIQPNITIGVFLMFLIIGILLILFAVRSLMNHNQYIQSLEKSGQLHRVLQDFAQAGCLVDGKLRFGQYCLYAKGHGKLLPYSDIARVYQYVHKTNGVEDMRELKYVNREGKERSLCRLKIRGKSDADVHMAVTMLYRKNPNIQIGYR